MKKIISLILILFTINAFSCVLTVNMVDSYGDGWNGNSITILVNGTPVLTGITIATGSTATYTFNANTGDIVSISFDASGSWDEECEYTITNGNGAEIFEDGQGGTIPSGGTFTVDCSAMPPPPPPNDMPCDAISLDPITTNCSYQQFTTNMALNLSGVPAPSCGLFAGGDVWFSAIVPASGRLTVSLTAAGMIEGDIAIYTGIDCNTLSELRCAASTWAVPMPSINVITGDGLAGETVWIRVWEPNNDNQNTFNICAFETPPPPANNEPCGGIALTVNTNCNFTQFSTMSATGSAIPDPSCSFSYAGGDVWFTAVVPASGRLAVQLGAAMMTDGGLAIYYGPDCNTLTELRCVENTWGMPAPAYVFELDGMAGQTVWIRVWEPDNDNQGTFDICAYEPDPMLEISSSTFTPEELVDLLITGCLEAYNVTFTGDPIAIGAFSNGTNGVGFNSGIILASGNVEDASAPGTDFASSTLTPGTGDADLDAILTGFTTNDATVLEFDFVPSSDEIQFNYVFGSEEYPEFVNSSFNDAFAFFISGGPEGYVNQNIALVPGTAIPVTIDNVNDITNSAYYIDNEIATSDVIYDGLTTVLTAQADVTACEEYHIKLVIADAGDSSYDSGVFLEAGSFSSGGDILMSHYSSIGNTNEVYEGCENYWVFSRVDTTSNDSLEVVLQISGSAENGVDITTFPNSFWLVPGQNSDTIYYSGIIDNLPEGTEYIVFALENGCPCTITTTNDTIWVLDNFDLQAEISNDILSCGNETLILSTYINPSLDSSIVTWTWDNGSTTQNITVSPLVSTTYYVTITDPCDQIEVLDVTITVVPELSASFTLADSICVGETTSLTFTGFSGPDATFTWNFDGATVVSGSGTGPFELMWTYPGTFNISLLISDNGCTSSTNTTIVVSAVPTTTFTLGEILCAGGSMNVIYTGTALSSSIYNWDFDGATILSGSGQGPYQVTWNIPGDYTITLNSVFENACSSLAPSSADVFIPQSLVISTTTQDISCFGLCNGTVVVTIEGGVEPYSYSWSDGFGVTGVGQINSLCAGTTYTVTVADANGCVIDTDFSVNQPSQITYTTSATDPLCHDGNNGISSVYASGGNPPYLYQWSNPENSTTASVSNLSAGNYTVSIYDNGGCMTQATVSLSNPQEVLIGYITDRWICIGQSVTLLAAATGGSPAYSYTWRNLTNGNTYFTPSITVSPIETTDFEVFVTDANNCVSRIEEVRVNVHPPISIEVSPESDTVCKGFPHTINAIISGGNGGPYIVTDQDGNYVAPPYQAYPSDNMSYIITANDLCDSPSDSDTLVLIVMPEPPNTFVAGQTSHCAPFTVNFVEINDLNGRTFNWNFGDYESYNTSSFQNPNHTFNNAGVYDITLITSSVYGCKSSLTLENYITVYPNPEANFIATPTRTNIINPTVFFQNQSYLADYSYWYFGDNDSSEFYSPQHRFPEIPGTYEVFLYVETNYGCTDSTSMWIIIEDEFTFWAPTAFSPNGDAINSHFFIKAKGILADGFQMFVYDRWGEKVYETNKYDETDGRSYGWDGKAKDNKIAKTGVYAWVIFYQDKNGNFHEKAGYVSLLR